MKEDDEGHPDYNPEVMRAAFEKEADQLAGAAQEMSQVALIAMGGVCPSCQAGLSMLALIAAAGRVSIENKLDEALLELLTGTINEVRDRMAADAGEGGEFGDPIPTPWRLH